MKIVVIGGTDPQARYFGARLSERTLLPGDGAQLGVTRFDDWLSQRAELGERTLLPGDDAVFGEARHRHSPKSHLEEK